MKTPAQPPAARPKCGVHVAVEMVLVETKPPSWVMNPDGADQTGEIDTKGGVYRRQFTRKSWKCPVAGCYRVAAYSPNEDDLAAMKKPCRKCGAETEGDAMHVRNRTGLCRACHREKCRKSEARSGLGKGFYSRAKAKRLAKRAEPSELGVTDSAAEKVKQDGGADDFAFVIRNGEIVSLPATDLEGATA